MKSIVWVLMLTAPFATCHIACNNAPTNNIAKDNRELMHRFH